VDADKGPVALSGARDAADHVVGLKIAARNG
jgi:hypothetical protein